MRKHHFDGALLIVTDFILVMNANNLSECHQQGGHREISVNKGKVPSFKFNSLIPKVEMQTAFTRALAGQPIRAVQAPRQTSQIASHRVLTARVRAAATENETGMFLCKY